jgi:hypothetical protein
MSPTEKSKNLTTHNFHKRNQLLQAVGFSYGNKLGN